MNYVSSLNNNNLTKKIIYKLAIAALLVLKIYALILLVEAIWVNAYIWFAIVGIFLFTIAMRYVIEILQISYEAEMKEKGIRLVYRSLFLTIRKKQIDFKDIIQIEKKQSNSLFEIPLKQYKYSIVCVNKRFSAYLDDYFVFLLNERGVPLV